MGPNDDRSSVSMKRKVTCWQGRGFLAIPSATDGHWIGNCQPVHQATNSDGREGWSAGLRRSNRKHVRRGRFESFGLSRSGRTSPTSRPAPGLFHQFFNSHADTDQFGPVTDAPGRGSGHVSGGDWHAEDEAAGQLDQRVVVQAGSSCAGPAREELLPPAAHGQAGPSGQAQARGVRLMIQWARPIPPPARAFGS